MDWIYPRPLLRLEHLAVLIILDSLDATLGAEGLYPSASEASGDQEAGQRGPGVSHVCFITTKKEKNGT